MHTLYLAIFERFLNLEFNLWVILRFTPMALA